MTAVIDFSIKKCFNVLSEDGRWNVLTVLMLHANVRNRCWVTMDTITRLATNGNRSKAVRAKQWLIDHGAVELVQYDQRMKHEKPEQDETKLSPRRHVYQLTGHLKLVDEKGVEQIHNYLYTPPAETPKRENETQNRNVPDTRLLRRRNSLILKRSKMKRSKIDPQSISSGGSKSINQSVFTSGDEPGAVVPQIGDVFTAYLNVTGGTINPTVQGTIQTLVEKNGVDRVLAAIERARQKRPNFKGTDPIEWALGDMAREERKQSQPQQRTPGDDNPLMPIIAEIYKQGEGAKGGRFGKIADWLYKIPGELSQQYGEISQAAEPDHLRKFAKWWAENKAGADMPITNFVENWRLFANSQSVRVIQRKDTARQIEEEESQIVTPTPEEMAAIKARHQAKQKALQEGAA